MRIDKRRFREWFFTVTLILTLTLTLSFSSSHSKAQSKKLVNIAVVKVTFADDTWVRASVVEGGALRIDETGEERLVINPVFDPLEKRAIRVRVLRGNKSDSIGTLEEICVVNLSLNTARANVDRLGITIQLEAVLKRLVERKNDSFQTAFKPQIGGEGSNCCVTCDGRQYCANCSVQTSCGCCNTPDCAGECPP
jgi:hypothetical protein